MFAVLLGWFLGAIAIQAAARAALPGQATGPVAVVVTAGAVIGALTAVGILAIGLATGWMQLAGWHTAATSGLLLALINDVSVGVMEETLFRGFVLITVLEGLHQLHARRSPHTILVIAVITSAAIFTYFHLNDIAELYQAVHYFTAGVVLAFAYVRSGRLALPIGLHIAYNFSVRHLLNVEPSNRTIADVIVDGPALWVGEASITETAAWLFAALLIVVYVHAARDRWTRDNAVVSLVGELEA